MGNHKGQHQVAHLALPQGVHALVASLTLLSTVPAEVVIGAISILLPIGIVVLGIVCYQVIQREAVMSYDKVDALMRLPA